MDDRDLEARLRTHLHRRFDGAQPPPEVVAAVRQVIATPPRRIALPALRARTFRPGWSVVAVALGVAVLAVAGLRFGGLLGPGGGDPTPSPTAAPPSARHFIVLPPSASEPWKTQSDAAHEVLDARLRALGVRNFLSVSGNAIQFSIPAEGPSDATVRDVLAATGEVEFVPLPPEDYGDGGLTAELGSPLPKDEPALFGWDGIASVERRADEQARPTLLITLKPAARDAFATHTESHIGESFAIVVDDVVALLPMINEPIPGGEIVISGGVDDGRFQQTLAILAGGMLPEAWARPEVPVVLPEDRVVAATLENNPSSTLASAGLDAIPDGAGWRAVWRIELDGEFRECIPGPSGTPSCLTATRMEFVIDAETGDPISSRSLEE